MRGDALRYGMFQVGQTAVNLTLSLLPMLRGHAEALMPLVMEAMGEAGLAFKGNKKERGTKLAGKTFVLTGTLPDLTRDEILRTVDELSGTVVPGFQ